MFKRLTRGVEEVAESSDSDVDSYSEEEEEREDQEEQESDFDSEEESILKKVLGEAGLSEEEDWDDGSDVGEQTTGLVVGELDRPESENEDDSDKSEQDSDDEEAAGEGDEAVEEEGEYKTVYSCDLCPEKVLKDEKMVELHLASHDHKKRERRLKQEKKATRTPEHIENLKAKNAKNKAKGLEAKKEALKKKRKAKKERQYKNKMAKIEKA
ncbi:hypothetical protein K7432_003224 [Basidiobolus ranarum]|uniref:C2H2-type domain-containing protein n=1 Tax=Basidiobolus ranarum TaxID=34480 RepID=A0ABR2W6J4_9FUNG